MDMLRQQKGQAIVEYILLLLTVIGAVFALRFTFQQSFGKFSQFICRQTTAPWPGAEPPNPDQCR
jgi:hypothetical protein